MADMRDYEVFSRIGVQADRTTTAVAFVDVDINKDGMSLNSSKTLTPLATEHRFRGSKFRLFTKRNSEAGSLSTGLFPLSAGTFFDAVFHPVANNLKYHTWEFYWDASIGGDTGERFEGVIMDGLSFTLDRDADDGVFNCEFSCFINAKANVSSAVPTFVGSAIDPFLALDTFIDFRGDTASGAYGADNADLLSVQFAYQNTTELKAFRPSATTKLNKTWTKHFIGIPTCTVTVELIVSNDDYTKFDEGATPITGAIRMAGTHPNASLVTTSTENIATGDTGTFVMTVASGTGAAVGDVIFVQHSGTLHFATFTLTAVVTNDLSFDRTAEKSYVNMNGASGGNLIVKNMAWGIVVPRMTLVSSTQPKTKGNVRVVTLSYEADLLSGETAIVVAQAYNHSAAHV